MQNKFDGRVFVLAHLLWNTIAAEIQNDCKPKDCYDLKCYGVSKGKDGPHTIYPGTPNLRELQVSCDQETDGGGWIIYQRRLDGSVNFTRNWDDYKHGFGIIGDDTTEMWLGNENVHQLLNAYGSTEWELWLEVHSFDGDVCSAKCYPFQISTETSGYKLDWTSVDVSAPVLSPDLSFLRNTRFTTFDKINCQRMCIDNNKGGWWYASCGWLFLNGEYVATKKKVSTSIYWQRCTGKNTLQKSCMMFRPINSTIHCSNPCKNNGRCGYVATTKRYLCSCPSDYCGALCEIVKPCKVGTCEYDTATQAYGWKCADGADDESDSSSALVFGVIIASIGLLIVIAAGVAFFIYRQKRKQKEERERVLAGQSGLGGVAGYFSFLGW